MSPERDADKFINLLKDSNNYKLWYKEFKRMLNTIFEPLSDYFLSDDDKVVDYEGKEIKNDIVRKTTLDKYNTVLISILRTSVTPKVRNQIDIKLVSIDDERPHFAKELIKKICSQFGQMTLRTAYDLLFKLVNLPEGENNSVRAHTIEGSAQLFKKPELMKFCFYFLKGLSSTRKRIMDKFGGSTDLDFEELYNVYHTLEDENEDDVCDHAFFQTTISHKKKNKWNKRNNCPKYKGFHAKNDCPAEKQQQVEYAKFASHKDNTREVSWIVDSNPQGIESGKWYLDSGCTSHISNHQEVFTNLNFEEGPSVAGLTESIKAAGKGDAKIHNIKLADTLYVPHAPCNLLSISKITSKSGNCVIFTDKGVFMLSPKELKLTASKRIGIMVDGLYEFFIPRNRESSFWTIDIPSFDEFSAGDVRSTDKTDILTTNSNKLNSAELWHARLGHPGRGVYEVASKMADLPRLPLHEARVCPTCALSKGKKSKGKSSSNTPSDPLELVQVDICGGFRYHDYVGYKYFLTIIERLLDFPLIMM